MWSRETTFYIGRLNIIYSRTGDKKSFIADSLSRGAQLSRNKYEWGFFETGLIETEGKSFAVGFLVKYKPSDFEETVDRYERKLMQIEISDRAIAKSKFVLDINSGLIAYNPVSSHIRESTFRSVFANLFEKANNGFLVSAEIRLITEAHNFLAKMKVLDSINRIRITLHPSNPNTRPIWAGVDKLLKDINADTANLDYRSDELNIIESSRVNSEIMMAVDGYGKAVIYGTQNEKGTMISTEDTPVKVKDTLEGNTKKIENKVLVKLLRLISGSADDEA